MAGICAFDRENPLGACKGESLRANRALRDYAFMGPGRSLRKLLEKYREQSDNKARTEKAPTNRFSSLADWSTKYQWQDRVALWEALQDAAIDQRWAERRSEHREDEWELRDSLVELAKNIIAEGPKFLQTRRRTQKDQDGRIIEIVTVALDARLAVEAAEAASKLGRLASNMETDRSKQSIEHSGAIAMQPDSSLGELSDADLDQLIRNLSTAAAGEIGPGADRETAPADAD